MYILLCAVVAVFLFSGTGVADVSGYDVLGKKVALVWPELAEKVNSVYAYDREAFRPDGVRAGSFDVYGTAAVDVVFNDNIFADEVKREADILTQVKPALIAKSDWGRHEIVAETSADIGTYADNSDENYTDYNAHVSGRLDVVRNSYAVGGIGLRHLHEARGTPNATTGTTQPTTYDVTTGQVGYVHAPGRFSVSGLVDYTDTDYADNGAVNNDDRDRTRMDYTTQVGYQVTPAYQAFLRGTYTDVAYAAATDDNGFNRDSDGYRAVTGVALDLGGKLRGEVFAGYMARVYADAQLADVTEVTYGADILWNINGLTSVQGRFNRTVEETMENGAAAYISTGGDIRLEHEFRRYFLASASVGLTNNAYTGGISRREDDYTTAGLETRYLFNKCFSAGFAYNYTQRDSTVAGDDYDRNRVMLKLTGAL